MSIPISGSALASQMAAAAQAAVRRAAALRREAISNQKLWEVAQQAEQAGDLPLASRLYQTLSLRKPRSKVTVSAQQRLSQMQGEALKKLEAIEGQLAALGGGQPSPNDALRVAPGQLDPDQVTPLFEELEQVALEYAGVATVDNKVQDEIDRLRGRPQYAAILNEPAAAQLWKLGQTYEKQDQTCCAVLAYEQASILSHAPSARAAQVRLAELNKDQAVVLATRRCRNLQICHEHYQKAQEAKDVAPRTARDHLAQILELAPPDTTVHKAAREQLAMLK